MARRYVYAEAYVERRQWSVSDQILRSLLQAPRLKQLPHRPFLGRVPVTLKCTSRGQAWLSTTSTKNTRKVAYRSWTRPIVMPSRVPTTVPTSPISTPSAMKTSVMLRPEAPEGSADPRPYSQRRVEK